MVRRVMVLLLLLSISMDAAGFRADIAPITANVKNRMIEGNSWHRGCPVTLHDLRYIRLSYHDFQGKSRIGELVMHKEAAGDIVKIFKELYEIGYPVKSMRLVSDFGGNDWRSIEADNTSAFNCRKATGSRQWSKHAYGRAIDLNPIENPYISRSGHIAHKESLRYRKRVHHANDTKAEEKAVLLKRDKATGIFKKYGWRWGGDWIGTKDYQHFYKPQEK